VDSKDSFLEQIRFKAAFREAVLGVMERLVLSDATWERMAPLIIGRPDQKGSTGRDNRMFVEGVLWIVRTGSPWRDLPEAFGDWNSVFRRFSRWSRKGVWWRIFEAIGAVSLASNINNIGPIGCKITIGRASGLISRW
jgi:putative transposase